jgi:hypothetical protein
MQIQIGIELFFNYNGGITSVTIESIGCKYAKFHTHPQIGSILRFNLKSNRLERKMPGGWWDSIRCFMSFEDADYWIQCQLAKLR